MTSPHLDWSQDNKLRDIEGVQYAWRTLMQNMLLVCTKWCIWATDDTYLRVIVGGMRGERLMVSKSFALHHEDVKGRKSGSMQRAEFNFFKNMVFE
jgi:hypothetical protein